MNGMPHGDDYCPSSGFGGQLCIHFFKSGGHSNGGAEDPDHQAAVKFAYNAAQ